MAGPAGPAGRAPGRAAAACRTGAALPLVGRALRRQGQHRHRRRAHHGRLPGLCLRARAQRHRGAAPARCRRAVAGQDQPGPVRHRPGRHALALRPAEQRLRRHAHQRRLQLGLGGGRGARPGRLLAGHRHSRLGPGAGRLQRSGGVEAHPRACQHRRRGAGLPQPGLRVGVHAHGRRCRPAAGADRRRRCAGHLSATSSPARRAAGGGAHRRAEVAGLLRRRRLRADVRCRHRTCAGPGPAGGGAGLRAAVRRGGAAVRRPVGGRAPQRGARAARHAARGLRPGGAPGHQPRVRLQRHRHLRGAVQAAPHATRAAVAVAAGRPADGAHRARPSALRRGRCRPAGRERAASAPTPTSSTCSAGARWRCPPA